MTIVVRRTLECGCTFLEEDADWMPCSEHGASSLKAVKKISREVISSITCSNCGVSKMLGKPCSFCGVDA